MSTSCPRCGRVSGAEASGPVAAVVFDWYDTVAELPAAQRSAAFDGLVAELGLDVAPGALWDEWRSRPAWERSPLDERLCGTPSFDTFACRWEIAGDRLLAAHGAPDCGLAFAAMQERLHAGAPPFADAATTLDALLERYQVAVLSDADTTSPRASARRGSRSRRS